MKAIKEAEFQVLCSKVAELTDGNDHTNAKLVVAKFFDLKYYIRVFEYCAWQHNADGFLNDDVASIRRRNGILMMEYLKAELTAPRFERLRNSF